MKHKLLKNKTFDVSLMWSENIKFDAHSHNELVLSCNLSGNENLIIDGTPNVAPQKYCTLYNPGQVQAGNGAELIVSLYIQPKFVFDLLSAQSTPEFETPIVNDIALHRQFTKLCSDILCDEDAEYIEETATKILDIAFTRYTASSLDSTVSDQDWRIQRIKDHLMADLSVTPKLDELASDVGLKKLRLLRLFTHATGVPPITWQRYQRIAAARQFLRQGQRPTDVAYDLGFADQPHLTRLFKSAYGISPAKFAKM